MVGVTTCASGAAFALTRGLILKVTRIVVSIKADKKDLFLTVRPFAKIKASMKKRSRFEQTNKPSLAAACQTPSRQTGGLLTASLLSLPLFYTLPALNQTFLDNPSL